VKRHWPGFAVSGVERSLIPTDGCERDRSRRGRRSHDTLRPPRC